MFFYNKLITLRHRFRVLFSNLEIYLKRRYAIIPDLVSNAKPQMEEESDILDTLLSAGSRAEESIEEVSEHPEDPEIMGPFIEAEKQVTVSLKKISDAVKENPAVKADPTILELLDKIFSTDKLMIRGIREYNETVEEYNELRRISPYSILAEKLNLPEAVSFYTVDEDKEQLEPGEE